MPAPGWTHALPNGRTCPRSSTVDTAPTRGPLWTTTAPAHDNPPTRRSDRDVSRRIVTQAGFRHKFLHLDHTEAQRSASRSLARQKITAARDLRGTSQRL